MIAPKLFYETLKSVGVEFYTGVPDSLLKSFCAYVSDHTSKSNHVIAANEGAAIGMAAGYHLATGGIPLVYMQNSGIGNAVNPLLSICDEDVYSLPMILLIGWRGEPGVKDEPQHVKQGKVLLPMLDSMGIPYAVIGDDEHSMNNAIKLARSSVDSKAAPFALIASKAIFEKYEKASSMDSIYSLTREGAIQCLVDSIDAEDIVVSTTGMASRELFEYRMHKGQGYGKDFLTVGGMGHASQIALGVALAKKNRNIYCLDGDGAMLMHMGGVAIIGQARCTNFKHILINNGAHDSVGGQPTVGFGIDIPAIALASGYKRCWVVCNKPDLKSALAELAICEGPSLLEVRVRKGSRSNLGRPTASPEENKKLFMEFLS